MKSGARSESDSDNTVVPDAASSLPHEKKIKEIDIPQYLSESAERNAAADGSDSVPQETDAKHVLVVEDDPVILELLQDVLSNGGFRVLIAKNAADGLALFRSHAETTVCVILDYGIPGMHASRLLERFLEVDQEVKVILSSGYPQNFIGEDFPLDKIAGFMAKPYDPQVLISELENLGQRLLK
jgi:CheY-like chemotaxis protein